MNITSISLAYVFFAISVISLIFFLYFKVLVIKTDEKKPGREKILGNMKNPDAWRKKNNLLSFVSLFWSFISICAFIYLKYFHKSGLVSTMYLIGFVVAIAFSSLFFALRKRSAK